MGTKGTVGILNPFEGFKHFSLRREPPPDDLARIAGMSVRSLHRLFERHVGVGPKWIVHRSRVQEAAERVARGQQVDWAGAAQELGYHDQAHLIRDFRAQIGSTPAAYARQCESSVSNGAARSTTRERLVSRFRNCSPR